MEQIVKDITGLVGGTPLLEAARFGQGCCASWSI